MKSIPPSPLSSPTSACTLVVDRHLLWRRRERASAAYARHTALYDAVGESLLDRLHDVTSPFSAILELGGRDTVVAPALATRYPQALMTRVCDGAVPQLGHGFTFSQVDAENLPFASHSFDLILSNGLIHGLNAIPQFLQTMHRMLRPEGLFLAAFMGGNTLCELRQVLLEAEIEVSGGVSPHVAPTIDLLTASHLIQRSGLSIPVVDSETFTLTYTDIYALMHDLRGMGESNALLERSRRPLNPKVFRRANDLYSERYKSADGGIMASFDVLFLHGWR